MSIIPGLDRSVKFGLGITPFTTLFQLVIGDLIYLPVLTRYVLDGPVDVVGE
jgi:hypothetical protein